MKHILLLLLIILAVNAKASLEYAADDKSGSVLTYDALTTDNFSLITSYTWDIDNHHVSVSNNQSGVTSFEYDALGRRVSKSNDLTGTTLYVSHGQRVIEEYSLASSTYSLATSYVHGTYIDDIVAQVHGSLGSSPATPVIHYYHSDRQYNIRGLTDASGNILELYAYTPYGKQTILDPTGNSLLNTAYSNQYGFTGRRLDAETGLWYFRARYFSVELGRFISRDPLGYVDGYGLYNGYFAQRFAMDPSGLSHTDDCPCEPDGSLIKNINVGTYKSEWFRIPEGPYTGGDSHFYYSPGNGPTPIGVGVRSKPGSIQHLLRSLLDLTDDEIKGLCAGECEESSKECVPNGVRFNEQNPNNGNLNLNITANLEYWYEYHIARYVIEVTSPVPVEIEAAGCECHEFGNVL